MPSGDCSCCLSTETGVLRAGGGPGRLARVVPSGPSAPTPTPTPTVSPWPEITAAQIAARLYLDAPNRISDPAALDHSSC